MTSPKLAMLQRKLGIQPTKAMPAPPTDDLTAAIAALVDQRVAAALAQRPDTARERALETALVRSLGTVEELQRQALARPLEPPPPRRERLPMPQSTPAMEPALPAMPAKPMQAAISTFLYDGLGTALGTEMKDASGRLLLKGTVVKRDRDGRIKQIAYSSPATDDRPELRCIATVKNRNQWDNIETVKYEKVE